MKHFGPKILLLLALVIAPALAFAQDFDFRPPTSATDPALPAAMKDLAQRVLPVYQENDQDRYLSNLSALQLVAGDPVSAYASRQSLQERRRNPNAARPVERAIVYDIYARARAIESQVRTPFGNAYSQAFRDALNRVDDLEAHVLERSLTAPTQPLQEGLQRALDQRRGKTSISLNEAVDLIWAWFAFESYRSFSAVVRPLVAAEDKRRYVTDEDVTIGLSKDAVLTVTVVRPRIVPGKLPAILEFALDTETRDALESAAHGYVSVLARSRGLRDKTDPLTPFQSEGDDARAVIEWMARQPWSNGRVGLLGAGYGGYVAWASTKRIPPALKAIVTTDPMAPGIDLPMAGGGIFFNSSYRWLYSVTAPTDDKLLTDDARWRALDEDWYKNGRRYREFPTLPGRASTIFRNWINHPSYDRYWQKMLPFRQEFARINIPVLTVTGYYSSGATASLYYFNQHHQHNAHANHALLIGPYDDQSIQRGPATSLRGLQLDSAAVVELHDAWYEWFDHALKGAKRPALLSANVNYQLTGTNEWRHTATFDAPEHPPLRFYLVESASPSSDLNALAEAKPAKPSFLPQTFDLQDRSDIGWRPLHELVQRTLKARDGELFVSEPLKQAVDVAGALRGQLDFTVNKVDMDLVVSLYELRPNGDYVKLFDPSYAFRASYARDRTKRNLLRAGVRQQLSFRSERMMARRLQAGSRLIMALGLNKRADQQLNYGTGDDVSEESIEDASVPVRIRWYNSSFVEIPTQ
jgi:putative CocE/NonD family hydrolase